jgi:hypothetical protein
MSLLKEFFRPKNKKDGLTLLCIFLAVGSFVVFEGYAFYTIMQNPYRVDVWNKTEKMWNTNYLPLSNSILFNTPADLDGYQIFQFSLEHLKGLSIKIELDAVNCIIEMAAISEGALVTTSHGIRFEPNETNEVNITDGYIVLDVRQMDYPSDYDIIFIKTVVMGSNNIEIYHKVSIL